MTTTLEASAYLHHLHMTGPDPRQLAQFYAEVMDMAVAPAADKSWIVRGPDRRIQFSEGGAKTLRHAGFALRDQRGLEALRHHAARQGLAPQAASTPFFREGAFSVVDPDDNLILFGLSAEEPTARGLRGPLQHLTLATRNVLAIEEF
jgi:catechol 2,3-dioxygenase